VDALGNLVGFLLLPGQAHDMKGVPPLIRNVSFGALLADKAFDANWLLEELDARGTTAVIPPETSRKHQRDYDADVYKCRHLVENYLRKNQGIQGYSQTLRQDRLQLRRQLEPRRSPHRIKMIVHRP